jgi:hypothetical protein
LGGDGNGSNNFVAITTVASLCLLVSTTQKEERENIDKEGQTKTKREKITIEGL